MKRRRARGAPRKVWTTFLAAVPPGRILRPHKTIASFYEELVLAPLCRSGAPLETIKSCRNSIVLQGCPGTGYALLTAALATLHRNALRLTRGAEAPLWE